MDELFKFTEKIKKRRNDEYKMQLVIASNPYSKDPKALMNLLDKDSKSDKLMDSKLDKDSFSRLREQLSKSKSIKVK